MAYQNAQKDKNRYISLYEKLLTELSDNGNLITLSPEENHKIMCKLNEGMAEFTQDTNKKATESLLEARHIHLG